MKRICSPSEHFVLSFELDPFQKEWNKHKSKQEVTKVLFFVKIIENLPRVDWMHFVNFPSFNQNKPQRRKTYLGHVLAAKIQIS